MSPLPPWALPSDTGPETWSLYKPSASERFKVCSFVSVLSGAALQIALGLRSTSPENVSQDDPEQKARFKSVTSLDE